MEGAGGVNAHQLTGDSGDGDGHDIVGDEDIVGDDENENESASQQKPKNPNFQGQCSATGRWPAGLKS